MQENHSTKFRPAAAHLCRDIGKPRNDVLLVGLVLQPVDPVTPGSVIAGGPAEQHDRPAARQHRPIGSRPDRKRVGGQPKPVICVEGRGQHLHIVDPQRAATTGRARRYRRGITAATPTGSASRDG